MKKRILAIAMMITALVGSSLTALAAETAKVSFTQDNELVYSNVTQQDSSSVNLGDAFAGVAPGETRSATITLQNDNDQVVDFYMNAQVLQSLEENRQGATGAGYEIKMTAAGVELYNSLLGGYTGSEDSGSTTGLKALNDSAISNDVLVATLKKGETADIVLEITFDGEAMDNTSGADYSNAVGSLSFAFKAGYEDPSGTVIVDQVVTQQGATRYVTQIIEEVVEAPAVLGAVRTGDNAMIIGGAAILAAGVVLLIVTGKKKKTEEQS